MPFFLEIEKYCFFLDKTIERPYLDLHFKFHDFFSHEITKIEDFKFWGIFLSKHKPA